MPLQTTLDGTVFVKLSSNRRVQLLTLADISTPLPTGGQSQPKNVQWHIEFQTQIEAASNCTAAQSFAKNKTGGRSRR
jgi:hypothetical protein